MTWLVAFGVLPVRSRVLILCCVGLCCACVQVARVVAQCKSLAARRGVIPAADITAATSSTLAAIASADVCVAYAKAVAAVCREFTTVRDVGWWSSWP